MEGQISDVIIVTATPGDPHIDFLSQAGFQALGDGSFQIVIDRGNDFPGVDLGLPGERQDEGPEQGPVQSSEQPRQRKSGGFWMGDGQRDVPVRGNAIGATPMGGAGGSWSEVGQLGMILGSMSVVPRIIHDMEYPAARKETLQLVRGLLTELERNVARVAANDAVFTAAESEALIAMLARLLATIRSYPELAAALAAIIGSLIALSVLSGGAVEWDPEQYKLSWTPTPVEVPVAVPGARVDLARQTERSLGWRVSPVPVPRGTPRPRPRPGVRPEHWERPIWERNPYRQGHLPRTRPHGEWNEEIGRWIEEASRPLVDPALDPLPNVSIGISLRPDGDLDVDLRVDPRQWPRVRTERTRRWKEQKTKSQLKYIALLAVVNKTFGRVTEVGDFFQALLDSLEYNGVVYRRWDYLINDISKGGIDGLEFHMSDFVMRVLYNHIEDLMIGRLSQAEKNFMLKTFGPGSMVNNAFGMPSTWARRFAKMMEATNVGT